ncbi:acyl-CoA carboxylase subunit epsilon [Flindersiella endophytica]
MDEPLLKVVKGDPTPAELAAVVSAVTVKLAAARSTSAPHSRGKGRASGWAAYWRNVRQPLRPGPGAWRRSALPR